MRQAVAWAWGGKGMRVMFSLEESLEIRVLRARRMGGWGFTMRSSVRMPMRRGLAGWSVVSGECILQYCNFGAHRLLVAFSPWNWDERGLVEPGFLIDECFHEDLDALETGAERSNHRDDLLLAEHRSGETIEWQTVGCRFQTEQPLVCSRRSDGTADVSADSETTATDAQQSTFASTTAPRRELCVVWVHRDAVDIARRLKMHQRLRLRRPSVEHAAGIPEELQDQAIV
jgi:hypothetical protein